EQINRLVLVYPHLGRPSDLVRFDAGVRGDVLADFADRFYGDREPLLRVALSRDARSLIVAAHHGAVDGLGLLGAAARVAGISLDSSARGVGPTAQPKGFVRRSVGRVAAAVVHPPERFAAVGGRGSGDVLVERSLPETRPNSAALLTASTETVRLWNTARRARQLPGARPVVAMGLSRRPGSPPAAPDRDTAYARVPVAIIRTVEEARAVLATISPEPVIPETKAGGLGALVGRVLSKRLGATVLVSNLGVVKGAVRVNFWPVPTGPSGVAIGLASTPETCTLTVRARGGSFSRAATEDLANVAADALRRAANS
ncbi:MAG TPA: hypothetical protein VN108_02845, partial [Marmoricola sp.]|nr:hypothetical protein [Marmoricola sp.]